MKERSDSSSSNKRRSSFNNNKRSNFHHKSYENPENELATIEVNYDVNNNEKYKLTYKNIIKKYSYDVDTLLELRKSTLVEPFDQIPNDFWRLHVYKKRSNSGNHYGRGSFQKNSSLEGGESSTGEMGSFSVKNSNYSSNRRSSGNHNRNYNRNNNNNNNSTGFFGSLDYEEDEEGAPEWLDDTSNVNSKDNSMSAQDLGKSVGDFEKWKIKMRLKEKKKQGIPLTDTEESQLDSILNDKNYVIQTDGGFFSFGADSAGTSNSLESTLEDTTEQHGSSRFSSFFKSESSNDIAVSDEHASSKILAMLGKATGDEQVQKQPSSTDSKFQNNESPMAAAQISSAISSSSSNIKAEIPRSNHNDSFFMSLLNKKPEGSQTSSPQVAASSNIMNFLGSQNNVVATTPPPGLIHRNPSNIPAMKGIQMHQQQIPPQLSQQSSSQPSQSQPPQSQPQRPQQVPQGQPQPIYPPGLHAPPPGINAPNSGFPPGFPKVNHVQQLQPLPAGYPYGAQQPQQFQMPPQQLPPWLQQGNNNPTNAGMPPPGLMLGNHGSPANSTPGSSASSNAPPFQPHNMYQIPPYQSYPPGMGIPPNNQQMSYLYGGPPRQ